MAKPTPNEQKLVDVLFEVYMRSVPAGQDRDQAAGWLREQLAELGFKSMTVGSSWAMLIFSPDQGQN